MTENTGKIGLLEDLRMFTVSLKADKAGKWRGRRLWRASIDTPANDFNREIARPGDNPKVPAGAVRVMCDDDFYEVAVLPYRFEPLTCAEIVSVLWPDIERVVTYPDSGDYWWVAMADETLEVPGQPFEVWYHADYPEEHREDHRFESYATRAEAEYRARRIVHSITPETTLLFSVREWKDGVRLDGERFESDHAMAKKAA